MLRNPFSPFLAPSPKFFLITDTSLFCRLLDPLECQPKVLGNTFTACICSAQVMLSKYVPLIGSLSIPLNFQLIIPRKSLSNMIHQS